MHPGIRTFRFPLAAAGRRAFILPVVLALILISTLFLTASFQRQSMETRIVTRQLAEYRRHHEAFSVRAIVRQWAESNFDELAEMAKPDRRGKDEMDYGFVLPSDARIRVFVRDGQGEAHVMPKGMVDRTMEVYNAMLERLPSNRPDIRRRVGPAHISVMAAPKEVLEALLPEDGKKFAERVIDSRDGSFFDREALEQILRARGLSDEERNEILTILTFDPSVWRLDVLVEDDHGQRQFRMVIDRVVGQLNIREWFELPPPADEGDGSGSPIRRSDRAPGQQYR